MAWSKQSGTRHSAECKMAFGKFDPSCPRCVELINGADRREGYGSQRKRDEANSLRWIRQHDCQKSGCGPVCTFGDW